MEIITNNDKGWMREHDNDWHPGVASFCIQITVYPVRLIWSEVQKKD
jgi:hypothetical protein